MLEFHKFYLGVGFVLSLISPSLGENGTYSWVLHGEKEGVEEACVTCISLGSRHRFYKCLHPISPLDYICLNSSKLLPHGSFVIEIVREAEDCLDIDIRLPSRRLTEFDFNVSQGHSLVEDIYLVVVGNSTLPRDRDSSNSFELFFLIPCTRK